MRKSGLLARSYLMFSVALAVACGGAPSVELDQDSSANDGGKSGKTTKTSKGGNQNLSDGGSGNDAGCTGSDCGGEAGAPTCQGVDDPGCQLVAQGPACGDSAVDAAEGEQCDDGNGLPGDGCSGTCQLENTSTWSCPTPGVACTSTIVCSDGLVQGAEVCDDHNTVSGDGCAADCTRMELGYDCPAAGGACVKLCGNGKLEGLEACDDGDADSNDGCASTCIVEAGFRCTTPGSPCTQVTDCGNGKLEGLEACDDGNKKTGDGCSAACSLEPFWTCTAPGTPCKYDVVCGDGVVTAGVEICDTGIASTAGCLNCVAVDPLYTCATAGAACSRIQTCGNGKLEGTEACDTGWLGGTDGCSAQCTQVTPGYVCFAGSCFVPYAPACGNSIIDPGEECDSGQGSDPGCISCKQTTGYLCVLPGTTCMQEVCGNGIRTSNEQCDDSNQTANDGCSAGCGVETGWVCPEPGRPCIPNCGDGVLKGYEQCDATVADGALPTGCNSACMLDPGYYCTSTAGTISAANPPSILSSCIPGATTPRILKTVCGNGGKEPGESCDDANDIRGDGCSPECKSEPSCSNGTCTNSCGDGFKLGTEACDDGNTVSGDGCSATCTQEPNWTCVDNTAAAPSALKLRVTYRDFISSPKTGYTRHPDFEASWSGSDVTAELVKVNLDIEGKPDFNGRCCGSVTADCTGGNTGCAHGQQLSTSSNFKQWYRDTAGVNIAVSSVLSLPVQANGSYVYDSATLPDGTLSGLYPVDTGGWTKTSPVRENESTAHSSNGGGLHNFGFTSEVRYFFQYKGGESLEFSGDDDVWVFINRKLALDVGGLHPRTVRSVALDTVATTLGLAVNSLYEIALFHAERHTSASNFKLTLTGFKPAYSTCTPKCGDGVILPGELCDDGTFGTYVPVNPYANPLPDCTQAPDKTNPAKCKAGMNGQGYGYCNLTCKAKEFCGDGLRQAANEDCDNGVNLDTYSSGGSKECAPGCKTPIACGDDVTQNAFGEQCDEGPTGNLGLYNTCNSDCQLGPRCGDGVTQDLEGEACDEGVNNGGYGAASGCGFDCQFAPYCGDNIRQPPEACDNGVKNDNLLYSGCKQNCTLGPRCGDGIPQIGEACDLGLANSDLTYGGCKTTCQWGPRCGDGVLNGAEGCDLGNQNATGSYGGCQLDCTEGPRCGDDIVQTDKGEVCDAGSNNGRYGFCAADCKSIVACGDGIKNGTEQCDNGPTNQDGVYNGCQTNCTLGPWCGDSLRNGTEDCDDGANLGGYGACAPGCKYGARCGDGVVQPANGEQCDDGTNLGGYGACAAGCKLGPRCGDKVIQSAAGEQCDDGNTKSNDGCSGSCKTESWTPLT